MKVDKNTLKKIAHLARLEVDPKDEKGLIKDLEQIISWVDKLDSLDTEGVQPLTHMTFEYNATREDQPKNTLPHEDAMKNAPDQEAGFYRVPKVLK